MEVTIKDETLEKVTHKSFYIDEKIENHDEYWDYVEDTINVIVRDVIDERRNEE